MLSILLSWILGGFVFFVFGKLLINLCAFVQKGCTYGLTDTFFIGLAFVSSILTISSIWIPVNNALFWALLAVSVLYTFYLHTFKHDYFGLQLLESLKSQPTWSKFVSLGLLIVIVFYSLFPPQIYDMSLYYMQAMSWNETYRLIPGLGNIHGRFGFNSSILLLSSAFSLSDIFSFKVYGILGLSLFVFSCWLISQIIKNESLVTQVALALFSFTFIYSYRFFLSCPSTDVLPNILVAFILLKAILDKNALSDSPLTFLALPVFALTLKLSIAPLGLLCLILIFNLIKTKQYKTLAYLTTISFVIFIPWCIRNVMITGYLIYPFPSLDLFSFDWKIPTHLVELEKGLVSSWAKVPGMNYEDYQKLSFVEWCKIWLVNHFRFSPFILFTFLLAAISPLFVLILKFKKHIVSLELYVYLTTFLGFVFWFFLAPDSRFGVSFILIAGLSPLLLCKMKQKNRIVQKTIVTFAFAVGFSCFLYLSIVDYKQCKGEDNLSSCIYKAQSIQQPQIEYEAHPIGGITLYIPRNDGRCFDHKLACSPYMTDNLEMRGKTIECGFRIKHK